MTDDIDEIVALQRQNLHSAPTHIVRQWHAAIDEAAALENQRSGPRRRRLHFGSFFWGMAASAALALAVVIMLTLPRSDVAGPPPALVADNGSVMHPAAFSRGLATHLRDSRRQLVTLDSDTDRAELVLQLIEQNRLFEKAADQNDEQNLARVLRAFEPILLRLAATDIAPEDAAELREQLAFELNVMLTKLAKPASDQTHST